MFNWISPRICNVPSKVKGGTHRAQWEHLSFAIFDIFDLKRQLKLLEMACDQVQTCIIFPMRYACFPIKIG